jgi:hypothetical protein
MYREFNLVQKWFFNKFEIFWRNIIYLLNNWKIKFFNLKIIKEEKFNWTFLNKSIKYFFKTKFIKWYFKTKEFLKGYFKTKEFLINFERNNNLFINIKIQNHFKKIL